MILKNTNDGRSSSPNILTYWKKIFGVFLLCFSLQFQAQIADVYQTSDFSINDEILIIKNSSDSTEVKSPAKIYINSETEISGADFIAGNFEIVKEENLSKQKISDPKNIVLQKSDLKTTEKSAKHIASQIKKAVNGYDFTRTKSGSRFISFQKIYKNVLSPQIFHLNFSVSQENRFSFILFTKENLDDAKFFEFFSGTDSYLVNVRVRPPPSIF